MILVVFDGPGNGAADNKIQHAIANLIKKRLSPELKCSCRNSNVVITVGGPWRTGEFSVKEVTGCCLASIAVANETLVRNGDNRVPAPGFTRAAIGYGVGIRADAFSLQ